MRALFVTAVKLDLLQFREPFVLITPPALSFIVLNTLSGVNDLPVNADPAAARVVFPDIPPAFINPFPTCPVAICAALPIIPAVSTILSNKAPPRLAVDMPISLVHISIRTPKFMKANIIHMFTKLHTTFCMSNDDKKIQIFVRQMMRTVVPNILKYDKNISCVEAVAKKAAE